MDINEDTEEPNLIHVTVTSEMSKEEVVEKILTAAEDTEKETSKVEVASEIISTAAPSDNSFKITKLKTDCKYSYM